MPRVLNASSQREIYISFVATGESGPGESIQIPPQKSINIQVKAGTMKLYVWLDSELIWEGIAPVTQKPIVVHPEQKKVTYETTPLPNTLSKSDSKYWWILIVLLVLLGTLLIFWFINRS